MRARRSALDPDEQTARVHVPVRRAKTRERGYEVDVVISFETRRERFSFRGRRDDPETVAQPLHRRTGYERASLERIAHPGADVPGDRREQPAAHGNGPLSRVHEKEAAGAVGVLCLPGVEAGLPEESSLLVSGDPGYRYSRAEVPGVALSDDPARPHRRRHHRTRDIEQREEVVVPHRAMDVEHECSRSEEHTS